MRTLNADFSAVPHLDQWLGLWAMEPGAFNSLATLVQETDISQHLEQRWEIEARSGSSDDYWYRQDQDGVAVLHLGGSLQKHRASMSRATSTVIARRELRAAVKDDEIRSILLAIDSPGGTAAGTMELANEVAQAALAKPVFAHITDLGASAAYWIASAATKISANEPANVGSIGTYGIVHDMSALAAKEGVKVHVVRAGQFKGAGAPGTEVTEEQLAEVQRLVDAHNDLFLRGVAEGRGLSLEQVKQLADGRVHPAPAAQSLGLIDQVQTFEQALEQAKSAGMSPARKPASKPRKEKRMTATSKEIKAACPGASSDFIVACMDGERDLEQCQAAWMQEMATDLAAANEENQRLTAENTQLKADLDEAKKTPPQASVGVEPLEEQPGKKTSQVGYFEKVREVQRDENMSREQAMGFVNKNFPDLRAELIERANKK